jgi:hypothetical protein
MKADDIIRKAVDNAITDRATISVQIDELATLIGDAQTMTAHRDVGGVLSKYVETRQRSNEQLIKLAEIQRKIDESIAEEQEVEIDEEEIYNQLSNND